MDWGMLIPCVMIGTFLAALGISTKEVFKVAKK